jgi:prevent-host-death family protein
MKTVPVAEVESHFSTYLEQSQTEGPIVITQDGKAIAVLLTPQDNDDLERLLLGRSSRFRALLDLTNRGRPSGPARG